MADFLLEIGCEEIPARMIDPAREELRRRVADVLQKQALAQSPELEAYSTPRRLAVLAKGIADNQADVEEQATGPAWKAAFKDGQPATPAIKFA
ncbi:MAG TPA: glycine--tRNA ligase subunit beta, partial [Terriglobales bacterium]|nr:glycine--tRNA ligase subunit beta [Terriglobales bacterium]